MAPIELYAELLTNIRTVSFVASLRSESNKETKAELSADGQIITINHDGESASIQLPTQMTGGGSASLTLPARPSKDLTLRLKVEEKEAGFLKFVDGSAENVVPWPASELSDRLECQACGTSLLQPGRIHEWRDLPNENWAEMMDFWHCHKPHEHGGHKDDDASHNKGYSASSKLQAIHSVGFVGLSYFIFLKDDCRNIKQNEELVSSLNSESDTSLCCEKCGNELGVADDSISGWRIYKWNVQLRKDNPPNPHAFSSQKWISSLLLSSSENTGVRRFVVEPSSPIARSDTEPTSILLWLFTPDLCFSSSYQSSLKPIPRKDPTRAIKVYHKPLVNPADFLNRNSTSHEHLLFPSGLYKSLVDSLETSQLLLPAAARKFQDWDVGILERFDARDVALSGEDAAKVSVPVKEEKDVVRRGELESMVNKMAEVQV
ncbi:putative transporter [Venturia nashicola]|nr:putative transporter [Venturia nashicola]